MAKELGWIKVHRKIQDTVGYFAEPFCRNMAWIDLLLLANHDDNFFRFRGIRVDVKRGQTGVNIETFCDRWKWSRGKTERWLKELERDKKIIRQKTNITTLISIINYSQYQDSDKADGKASDKADGQQTVKQTDTNKNDKELKEGGSAHNLNGFACYNAEEYILGSQQIFEKICIATSKSSDDVKKELHLYHLWLAKKDLYPMGKGAVTAGVESWIHNAKNFKQKYNSTEQISGKVEKLPDANILAKKYS